LAILLQVRVHNVGDVFFSERQCIDIAKKRPQTNARKDESTELHRRTRLRETTKKRKMWNICIPM